MSGTPRVLLADIGGTNARFALAEAARHYLHETGQRARGGVLGAEDRRDP